jgi:hypothetical protein
MVVLGVIALIFAFVLIAALNKSHREETGVGAPTRQAMRNIRRNARRKGISEAQAYEEWLAREQRKRS